jgi:hypothetical protein
MLKSVANVERVQHPRHRPAITRSPKALRSQLPGKLKLLCVQLLQVPVK